MTLIRVIINEEDSPPLRAIVGHLEALEELDELSAMIGYATQYSDEKKLLRYISEPQSFRQEVQVPPLLVRRIHLGSPLELLLQHISMFGTTFLGLLSLASNRPYRNSLVTLNKSRASFIDATTNYVNVQVAMILASSPEVRAAYMQITGRLPIIAADEVDKIEPSAHEDREDPQDSEDRQDEA